MYKEWTWQSKNKYAASLFHLASCLFFFFPSLSRIFCPFLLIYTATSMNQQESAWTIYTVVLLLLVFPLAYKSRYQLGLLPFLIFNILSAVALIVTLAGRYHSDTVLAWADRSPIINHMPVFSILMFAGIVEGQLIYCRHVTVALQNRDRWISLYGSEKSRQRRIDQQQQQQKKKWPQWCHVSLLVVYIAFAIALLCVRFTLEDDLASTRAIMAGCIAGLAAVAAVHTIVSWSCLRGGGMERSDMLFLRVAPLLFFVAMAGMALEAWLFYAMVGAHHFVSMVGWILLETSTVYLPISANLILCLFVQQLFHLDRQFQRRTEQFMARQTLPTHY